MRIANILALALLAASLGAAERPWLVFNEDNDRWFIRARDAELSVAGLEAYVDGIAASGAVTHFFMCPCGQRASFASRAWEPIWQSLDPADGSNTTNHPWAVRAKFLHDRGIDPYAVWIARCRARGISPWLSMRMNDDHCVLVPHYFRNERFWREHPELRRCPDRDPWQPGQKGWPDFAYNYARPAVYARQLAMVRELLARYVPDGLELDWLRQPFCLTPGREEAEAHVLTAFMRDCRRAADAASARCGRRVALAVRLPPLPGACRRFGFEPETWAREGLADVFTFSDNGGAADWAIDLADWRRRLGPAVRLLAGTDTSLACSFTSRFRALTWDGDLPALHGWMARYRPMADGLYFFNVAYLKPATREEIARAFTAPACPFPRRFLPANPECLPRGARPAAHRALPASAERRQVVAIPVAAGRGAVVTVALDAPRADWPIDAVRLDGRPARACAALPAAARRRCGTVAVAAAAWTFPDYAATGGVARVEIDLRQAARIVWTDLTHFFRCTHDFP